MSKEFKEALHFDGYERSPISNINIEACTFYDTVKDDLIDHVSDLKLKQVYCNGQLQEYNKYLVSRKGNFVEIKHDEAT